MTPEMAMALSKAPALEEMIIDTKWRAHRWTSRPEKDKIYQTLREAGIPERIIAIISFV